LGKGIHKISIHRCSSFVRVLGAWLAYLGRSGHSARFALKVPS